MAVNVGPFQTIKEVGWNPADYLVVTLTHTTAEFLDLYFAFDFRSIAYSSLGMGVLRSVIRPERRPFHSVSTVSVSDEIRPGFMNFEVSKVDYLGVEFAGYAKSFSKELFNPAFGSLNESFYIREQPRQSSAFFNLRRFSEIGTDEPLEIDIYGVRARARNYEDSTESLPGEEPLVADPTLDVTIKVETVKTKDDMQRIDQITPTYAFQINPDTTSTSVAAIDFAVNWQAEDERARTLVGEVVRTVSTKAVIDAEFTSFPDDVVYTGLAENDGQFLCRIARNPETGAWEIIGDDE